MERRDRGAGPRDQEGHERTVHGLRIGGGLSLIAAVVAEFAAGTAGAGSGLAFRLLESGYRLNIPRLYAALVLLTVTGVAIFGITSFITWAVLHRWHESAVRREN